MSAPLIPPGLIDRLRKIANRGLQTSVTHLRETPGTEGDYGTTAPTWTEVGTYLGWVRQPTLAELREAGASVVSAIGTYRLHLESSKEVAIGDKFLIGGEEYVVQDTNVENTYRVFTTCLLRRRQ